MRQKTEKLPRGVRRRGDSLVVSFALADGAIERRALGPVSVAYAVTQRGIFQRQVSEGTYQKRTVRALETVYTVADLWETYLRGYRLAGKKAAWRQEISWAHLKPQFENVRADGITTASLTRYQEMRLAEGASAGTVNRELSALSAALYHAAKNTVEGGKSLLEHVPIFPAKLVEAPARKGFIGDKEYALLAANAKQSWLRALLACAYSFGFRRGELLGLRVGQVDLFGGWIQLYGEDCKNGENRKIKLTQECIRLLAPCCACKKDSELVLTRTDGGRVVDFRKEWKALVTACGLPWLRLHDFRRSAIRNATRRGVSQTVAMRISGHKTASVFRRYDIVDERDLEQATAKIEAGREAIPPEKTDTKTDTSALELSAIPS